MSGGAPDPLRVLYVIEGLGPGGAETSLAEMLEPLRREGIELSIATLRPKITPRWQTIRDAGQRIDILPGASRLAKIRSLRKRIRAERPAVIHTTLFHADLAGRLAAWRTGIPVLTSIVNTTYDPVRLRDPNVSRFAFRATRALDRWTAHLTAHFHAITHAVKAAAIHDLGLPAERITVIERGRSPERMGRRTEDRRRRARGMLGLSEDHEVVIQVGRQEFQKGHRHLAQAMDLLGGERPRLVLLLAGRPGHATPELETLVARSPYRDRIRLLGYREDVPELLAAADLFAFPSLYEGLGGALVEAMALSLPVVASDLPAVREVVDPGRNALLVERGSPSALASAVRELLDDEARARSFGDRSREIFEARFGIETIAARTAALYRDVAGSAMKR